MMNRTRGSGFTLLELLIVVIIVGILAGVALPQFNRMTMRARRAEAQNMLNAIMTAEMLYYQEQTKFTNFANNAAAATQGLMVDLPLDANTPWDYAASGASAANVTVTATGETSSPVENIVVTGTVRNDGSRTIN